MMFASQGALVIANARRYREEQRARNDLETLINTSPVGVAVFDAGTGMGMAPSFNREATRIVDTLRDPAQSPEPAELGVPVEEARRRFDIGGVAGNVTADVPADVPRVMADRRRMVDVQCPVKGVVQVDQIGHRVHHQFSGVCDGFPVLGQVQSVVALLDVVVRTERCAVDDLAVGPAFGETTAPRCRRRG